MVSGRMAEKIGRLAGQGAKTIDLISQADRTAANQLYGRFRLEKRDANVYRMRREWPEGRRYSGCRDDRSSCVI